MDLLALQDFALVARHGGISAASRVSGRSKATLSRQVARLEDSLQVRLVERGPSLLRLTTEGQNLAARAEELLAEVKELGTAIQGRNREPAGRLRLSAPLLFSHVHLGALAAAFQARYPKVILEAHVEDRRVALVEENYDVVIRVNPPPTHGLVGKCFLRDQLVLVAPPNLSERSRSLKVLPAVVLSNGDDETSWWVQTQGSRERISARAVLRLPSYLMIRTAVLNGAGVAAVPRSIVENDLQSGALSCLGVLEGGATEVWVLHTAKRLTPRKVSAFADFVCKQFSKAGQTGSENIRGV
jgi:DNA-binding transcriptional LysR family regulator